MPTGREALVSASKTARDRAKAAHKASKTHNARTLAASAANRLERLADDLAGLAKIERPAPAAIHVLASARDSRHEAAVALERLAAAFPAEEGAVAQCAANEGRCVRLDIDPASPTVMREWAAEWRAFFADDA